MAFRSTYSFVVCLFVCLAKANPSLAKALRLFSGYSFIPPTNSSMELIMVGGR